MTTLVAIPADPIAAPYACACGYTVMAGIDCPNCGRDPTAAPKPPITWKVRRRKYMTGKAYWIVVGSDGRTACSQNGLESRYPDKANAQWRVDQEGRSND